MKKLVVCVDGVGFDLVSKGDTPFLFSLTKKEGFARAKTSYAFFGLEYSFFSGKTPLEHNKWLEFCYSKKGDFWWQSYFGILGRSALSHLTALVQYMSGYRLLTKVHNIPYSLLPRLKLASYNGVYDQLFFKQGSYFSYKWPIIMKNGKSRLVVSSKTDKERCLEIKKQFSRCIDTYYVHIVEFDKVAHKYGHKSKEARKTLKYYDDILKDLVNSFKLKFPDGDFLLWSDHSFIKIDQKFDLTRTFKPCKDYDCFIGGTSISFWFKSKKAKEMVITKLKGFDFGYIMTKKDRIKEKVPLSDKHGEIIFAIKKGNYLFPNYYQGEKSFNYMHGYPYSKEQDGFVISTKRFKKKSYYLWELTQILFGLGSLNG